MLTYASVEQALAEAMEQAALTRVQRGSRELRCSVYYLRYSYKSTNTDAAWRGSLELGPQTGQARDARLRKGCCKAGCPRDPLRAAVGVPQGLFCSDYD